MNRHPFRWGSAVFGLAFAAVAAGWTALELDVLDVDTAGVAAAATLIVLGVLGIIGTIVVSRRPQQPAVPVTSSPSDQEGEMLEPDLNDADHAGRDEGLDDTGHADLGHDDTGEVPDEHDEAPPQR
ncbi:hypothetical protein [Aeromicrobium sp. CTD01-1L150]|uniref:hypothetical protein n=1 Tax=Aeromicrobium sp. CTD01-1L150 TaxID=3341830 RepID=UPI0035BF667B